jgi:tetratricopeptide (TPR) repeat protein
MRRLAVLAVQIGIWALLLTGCGRVPQEAPPPPLPADMAGFDPEIVERIRAEAEELERDPTDATGWRGLGMLYHAHDQIELAADCYRQSLVLAPAEARSHFYLALAEQQSGRLGEAIAGMRRVIESDPSYGPARWRLGLWLLEQGDATAALGAVREAPPGAGDGAFFQHVLARASLQIGAEAEAAAGLVSWLEGHPEDRYGRFLLGTAYRRLGRADEARRQLALGRDAQPSWSDPWSEELAAKRVGFPARLTAASGLLEIDPARAVAQLERLRRDRPDNVTVLINLGIGYRRTGKVAESADVLREAVRIEATRGLAHFHLALTFSELSRRAENREIGAELMAEALEHAERTVELQPTSAKSHAMHGEMLARAGRLEAAVEAYSRAARDPQDPAWLYRLGGLLSQLGRWHEAIPVLESYLERKGTGADGLLLLGVAQANAGHPEAARASLERALLASPGEARIQQALEQLERFRRGERGPGA